MTDVPFRLHTGMYFFPPWLVASELFSLFSILLHVLYGLVFKETVYFQKPVLALSSQRANYDVFGTPLAGCICVYISPVISQRPALGPFNSFQN